jgi:hypothetical protein
MTDITKEIEHLSEKMFKFNQLDSPSIEEVILDLGPEGLKKAMTDMDFEQKELLKSVLTEMKKADKIPGGKADGKKPSDYDKKAMAEGKKEEMEHTSDPKIAEEIAMDHLEEDPKYYKKLKTIEKSLSTEAGWADVQDNHEIEGDKTREKKSPHKKEKKTMKKSELFKAVAETMIDRSLNT